MNLDEYQSLVLNAKQNQLVIAGPGSGKTTTILEKVHFLCEMGYEKDILLLSFTNKSVLDIKKRLKNDVYVTTFHSLAVDILKYNHIKYQICNEFLIDYILDEYIKRMTNYELNQLCIYLKISKLKFKSPEYESFKRLVKTFINLFKTNDKSPDILRDILNKDKYLMKIILHVFYEYEEEKKSTSTLDFDDLIKVASNYPYKKFKYIIIDEFQDTSLIRLNLVQHLYIKGYTYITVVGDDSQSIYKFSGCNLNIFLNFNKYFENVQTITLKNTYRNSQTLIDISEGFINKNPLQIKKGMISKVIDNNPFKIIYYLNSKKVLNKLLDTLEDDTLIISRNINDINEYLNKDLKYNENIIYKGKSYKYMTIHSSKGLEAKNVVILNCSNKTLGLPNKIENHPILDLLNPNDESYPYAEERRVFFVAITRCKERVYLLTPYDNPSPFIKEIKKMLFKHL